MKKFSVVLCLVAFALSITTSSTTVIASTQPPDPASVIYVASTQPPDPIPLAWHITENTQA